MISVNSVIVNCSCSYEHDIMKHVVAEQYKINLNLVLLINNYIIDIIFIIIFYRKIRFSN